MKQTKIVRFFLDFIYGTAGLIAMNGVMQFVVTPFLNNKLGPASCDRFLFFMALVGFMASAFGSGANYARMTISTRRESTNGDYNIFLVLVAGISIIVTIVGMNLLHIRSLTTFILVFFVMIATVLRYYSDVEYRLTTSYGRFFIYYMLIACGYLIGLALFPVTKSWQIIILFGECLALFFVFTKGSIYKGKLWERSKNFKENIKTMFSLSCAYGLSDFVSYTDRILIPLFAAEGASTTFYVATLVGKIVALLTTPLNGVIIGHLSKYQGKITKKMFSVITLALVGVAMIVIGASMVASHILVPFLYPDLYEEASKLFFVANASQVCFFLSNTMMVIVLRFTHEKYQLYLGIIYAALFFVIVLPAIMWFGLWGIAYGLLIINSLKFFIITAMGFYGIRKKEKE